MKKLGQSLDVDKIRCLRSERKWTQEQVAERLNISTSQYARLEKGKVSPRMEVLCRLAELFETELVELLAVAPSQTPLAHSSPEAVQSQQNQPSNVYHNNYYGNDTLAAELEKLHQALRHSNEKLKRQEELLTQLKTTLQHRNEEIAFLRNLLPQDARN